MMQQNTPKPEPPAELREGSIAKMNGAELAALLSKPGASEFEKAKAAQRAGELGATEAIPALAAMLGDEKLSAYGRYGLEPIAGPAADEALRGALGRLKGNLLMGVMQSIGKRRDPKALPALGRIAAGTDVAVAQAAIAAIGNIGGAEATKLLQALLPKTSGMTKLVVGDALLACAEHFLAGGSREQGLALYAYLNRPDVPQAVRHAAMSGTLREERSTSRPR